MPDQRAVAVLRLLADVFVWSTVVAAVVAAILSIARVRGGALRHAGWLVVLLSMLAMPVLMRIVPGVAIASPLPLPSTGIVLEPPTERAPQSVPIESAGATLADIAPTPPAAAVEPPISAARRGQKPAANELQPDSAVAADLAARDAENVRVENARKVSDKESRLEAGAAVRRGVMPQSYQWMMASDQAAAQRKPGAGGGIAYDDFMKLGTPQRREQFGAMSPENKASIMRTHAQKWLSENRSRLTAVQVKLVQDAIAFLTPELYRRADDPELLKQEEALKARLNCHMRRSDVMEAFGANNSPVPRATWLDDMWAWFEGCVLG